MSDGSITLPYEQAVTLGYGDVLIFDEVPRLIVEGPRDKKIVRKTERIGHHPAIYFTFPIHRRSWTGRAYTCYLWNDIKRRCRVPRRKIDFDVMTEAEEQNLRDIGFDPVAEIRREVMAEEKFIERIRGTSIEHEMSRGMRMLRACLRLKKRSTK